MWLETIIEAKNKAGISVKDMSKKSRMGLSEKTINRVLTKETPFPRLDTVLDIGETVGLSGQDIFAETTSVISDPNLVASLQAEVDKLQAELEKIINEAALISTDNAILKDKNVALMAEIDVLRMKINHKDEIIALHNYYINQKPNNVKIFKKRSH